MSYVMTKGNVLTVRYDLTSCISDWAVVESLGGGGIVVVANVDSPMADYRKLV